MERDSMSLSLIKPTLYWLSINSARVNRIRIQLLVDVPLDWYIVSIQAVVQYDAHGNSLRSLQDREKAEAITSSRLRPSRCVQKQLFIDPW